MGVRVASPGARTDATIAMPDGLIDALLTMVPPPTMATARALAMAGMVTVAPATAMADMDTVVPATAMADIGWVAATAGMDTVAPALDSVSASDAAFYFKTRPPYSVSRAGGQTAPERAKAGERNFSLRRRRSARICRSAVVWRSEVLSRPRVEIMGLISSLAHRQCPNAWTPVTDH